MSLQNPENPNFGRQSFQDYSMKVFTDMLDASGRDSQFIDSVQKTFREHNPNLEDVDDSPQMTCEKKPKLSPTRNSTPKRRELELDSLVGSQMKSFSEKKARDDAMI